MSQSVELTAFYRNYLQWVQNGAGDHPVFLRSRAMCGNLWCMSASAGVTRQWELDIELTHQFRDAGLDVEFPFGGYGTFVSEDANKTHHLNEDRILWVAEHLIGVE